MAYSQVRFSSRGEGRGAYRERCWVSLEDILPQKVALLEAAKLK
jgi:hypothetical protein